MLVGFKLPKGVPKPQGEPQEYGNNSQAQKPLSFYGNVGIYV
jgi:hypothetical protein